MNQDQDGPECESVWWFPVTTNPLPGQPSGHTSEVIFILVLCACVCVEL